MTSVIKIEKEYGIPYGKYSVNADLDYINSDEFAEKFNNVTDITALNKTLLNCSRAAINHRNNSLYEDMYIINGYTGEIMGQQLNAAYEKGINHNESIKLALLKAKSEKIPIVAFHSHPEGYPPSIDDFNSAYKYEYLLGVVCGHNGQVYTYKNNIGYVENADDLHKIISNAILGGFDVDRAYREAYEVIGLKYEIIVNDK